MNFSTYSFYSFPYLWDFDILTNMLRVWSTILLKICLASNETINIRIRRQEIFSKCLFHFNLISEVILRYLFHFMRTTFPNSLIVKVMFTDVCFKFYLFSSFCTALLMVEPVVNGFAPSTKVARIVFGSSKLYRR